jgi:hypothetical protein
MSRILSRKDARDLPARFYDRDIEIQKAEAAQPASKVRVEPNTRKEGEMQGNPIEVPIAKPRKDEKEQAQFEGKKY